MITIGADPELFIYDKRNEKIISSIGIIPGEKGNPYRSDDMPEGFGLEIDNILAEFNIPPCTTLEEWLHHMNYMKDYIRNFVQKANPDYDILCKASAHVDKDQLKSKEAKLFGCSVDYNVYTEKPNPKPKGESTDLRSTGCHIHLGYDRPNTYDSLMLVRYMDMYVGIPSVLYDDDSERRQLYGKAGSFRLCPYGLEYRVLSGAFIANDELMEFAFTQAMAAYNAFIENKELFLEDETQKIINEGCKEKAMSVCRTYNILKNQKK